MRARLQVLHSDEHIWTDDLQINEAFWYMEQQTTVLKDISSAHMQFKSAVCTWYARTSQISTKFNLMKF